MLLVRLTAVVSDGDVIAVPASAYAEALVGPARRSPSVRRTVDDFLADLAAEVEPITRHTAARAATSRATHGRRLELPDALVVAIVMHLGTDRILTTDRGWPRLPIEVLVARQSTVQRQCSSQ